MFKKAMLLLLILTIMVNIFQVLPGEASENQTTLQGWTLNQYTTTVADPNNSLNSVLKTADGGTAKKELSYELNGNVMISTKIYAVDLAGALTIKLSDSRGLNIAETKLNGGSLYNVIGAVKYLDGTTKAVPAPDTTIADTQNSIKASAYGDSQWFEFKMIFNMGSRTWDAYINSTLVSSDAAFKYAKSAHNNSNCYLLPFDIVKSLNVESVGGDFYVDDFVISQNTKELDIESPYWNNKINDNFDSISSWNGTAQKAEELGNTSNSVLKMTDGTHTYRNQSYGLVGDIKLSARLYSASANTSEFTIGMNYNNEAKLADETDEGYVYNQVKFSNGAVTNCLENNASSKILYPDGYPEAKWFDLEMVVSTPRSRYDLYIDGIKINADPLAIYSQLANDSLLWSKGSNPDYKLPAKIKTVVMNVAGGTGEWYIDDLNVYTYSELEEITETESPSIAYTENFDSFKNPVDIPASEQRYTAPNTDSSYYATERASYSNLNSLLGGYWKYTGSVNPPATVTSNVIRDFSTESTNNILRYNRFFGSSTGMNPSNKTIATEKVKLDLDQAYSGKTIVSAKVKFDMASSGVLEMFILNSRTRGTTSEGDRLAYLKFDTGLYTFSSGIAVRNTYHNNDIRINPSLEADAIAKKSSSKSAIIAKYGDRTLPDWYNIDLVMDLYNRVYDLYINGDKMNAYPLNFFADTRWTNNDVGQIVFNFDTSKVGMFYADDITVCSYTDNEFTQKPSINNANWKEVSNDRFESVEYIIESANIVDSDGIATESLESGGKINSISINKSAAAQGGVAIIALYADNQLCKIAKSEISGDLSGRSVIVTNLEIPEVNGADITYKVFVWNSLEGMIPMKVLYSSEFL